MSTNNNNNNSNNNNNGKKRPLQQTEENPQPLPPPPIPTVDPATIAARAAAARAYALSSTTTSKSTASSKRRKTSYKTTSQQKKQQEQNDIKSNNNNGQQSSVTETITATTKMPIIAASTSTSTGSSDNPTTVSSQPLHEQTYSLSTAALKVAAATKTPASSSSASVANDDSANRLTSIPAGIGMENDDGGGGGAIDDHDDSDDDEYYKLKKSLLKDSYIRQQQHHLQQHQIPASASTAPPTTAVSSRRTSSLIHPQAQQQQTPSTTKNNRTTTTKTKPAPLTTTASTSKKSGSCPPASNTSSSSSSASITTPTLLPPPLSLLTEEDDDDEEFKLDDLENEISDGEFDPDDDDDILNFLNTVVGTNISDDDVIVGTLDDDGDDDEEEDEKETSDKNKSATDSKQIGDTDDVALSTPSKKKKKSSTAAISPVNLPAFETNSNMNHLFEEELGGLLEEDLEQALSTLLGGPPTSMAPSTADETTSTAISSAESNTSLNPQRQQPSSTTVQQKQQKQQQQTSMPPSSTQVPPQTPAKACSNASNNSTNVPPTPTRALAGGAGAPAVSESQINKLQKLMAQHYQLLVQQAVCSVRAAHFQKKNTICGQYADSKKNSSLSSVPEHEYVGSESPDDLAEILDGAVAMLQDLDQCRKDAIRNSIQKASSNNNSNSTTTNQSSNSNTATTTTTTGGRRSLLPQINDLEETSHSATATATAAATDTSRTSNNSNNNRRLTRSVFTKTLLSNDNNDDIVTVFDVDGLSRLNETFATIDKSVESYAKKLQIATDAYYYNNRIHSTAQKGHQKQSPTTPSSSNRQQDSTKLAAGNKISNAAKNQDDSLSALENADETCKLLLDQAGADYEKEWLPGGADFSDHLSNPSEMLGKDFEPPMTSEQRYLLRRNRNLFTSAEDNLVLRGVNLYGEKQWLLIADRYLPDRSVNIISQRYSKLCLMLYKAKGIVMDEDGNLTIPPKNKTIDSIDEKALSKIPKVEPPALLNVHRWSLEEDLTLLRAVPLLGNMWAELSSRLIPHRDRGHLRKRYQVLERRVKATSQRAKKEGYQLKQGNIKTSPAKQYKYYSKKKQQQQPLEEKASSSATTTSVVSVTTKTSPAIKATSSSLATNAAGVAKTAAATAAAATSSTKMASAARKRPPLFPTSQPSSPSKLAKSSPQLNTKSSLKARTKSPSNAAKLKSWRNNYKASHPPSPSQPLPPTTHYTSYSPHGVGPHQQQYAYYQQHYHDGGSRPYYQYPQHPPVAPKYYPADGTSIISPRGGVKPGGGNNKKMMIGTKQIQYNSNAHSSSLAGHNKRSPRPFSSSSTNVSASELNAANTLDGLMKSAGGSTSSKMLHAVSTSDQASRVGFEQLLNESTNDCSLGPRIKSLIEQNDTESIVASALVSHLKKEPTLPPRDAGAASSCSMPPIELSPASSSGFSLLNNTNNKYKSNTGTTTESTGGNQKDSRLLATVLEQAGKKQTGGENCSKVNQHPTENNQLSSSSAKPVPSVPSTPVKSTPVKAPISLFAGAITDTPIVGGFETNHGRFDGTPPANGGYVGSAESPGFRSSSQGNSFHYGGDGVGNGTNGFENELQRYIISDNSNNNGACEPRLAEGADNANSLSSQCIPLNDLEAISALNSLHSSPAKFSNNVQDSREGTPVKADGGESNETGDRTAPTDNRSDGSKGKSCKMSLFAQAIESVRNK